MLVWISVGLAIVSVTGIWLLRRESLRCGQIDGALLVDGQLAPEGILVACQITNQTVLPCSPMCFSLMVHNRYAETSRDGVFTFKEIPAGNVTLGRFHGTLKKRVYCFGLITIHDEEPVMVDSEQLVVVEAKKRVRVVLGEGCLNVRGRLVLPLELQATESASSSSTVWFMGDAEGPIAPEGIDMAARAAWWKEASRTPDGIAWVEAVSRRYFATPDHDGNFVVPYMKPGRYTAHVLSAGSPDEHKSACGQGWNQGDSACFSVSVGNDSAASEVVELGDLPVFLRKGPGLQNTN